MNATDNTITYYKSRDERRVAEIERLKQKLGVAREALLQVANPANLNIERTDKEWTTYFSNFCGEKMRLAREALAKLGEK